MAGELNKVFICTNNQQLLGAKVAKYTLEKYAESSDLSVEILNSDEGSELDRMAGKNYLRGGKLHEFSITDLQSWTLLRFSPPELMNYQGRAVVIDPDVFSVRADVSQLFELDMKNKAILAKPGKGEGVWASSVMLLDCTKLSHWSLESIVDGMLAQALDYRKVMDLEGEVEIVGQLGDEWNRFDRIDDQTKFLHTTNRLTQPWRTGLPVDMVIGRPKPLFGVIPREWIHSLLGRGAPRFHLEHPDTQVTKFFFIHLKAAIESCEINADEVQKAVDAGQIRADVWEKLDQAQEA